MILESSDDTKREIDEIKLLESKGIDGILIIPVGNEYKHLEDLSNKNFPIVVLYRAFKDIKVNTVTIRNYSNAFDIVSILIKNKHKKIGLLQGNTKIYTNSERLQGYKDAFKKHNIEFFQEYIIEDGFKRECGYLGTKRLLDLPSPPTAIITTSDFLTLGALQAISENGLIIPNNIVLFCFDSVRINYFLPVPISTVYHPVEELGKGAVKILIDDINSGGKREKIKISLKSKLDINKSSLFLNKN
jgi:LacI family transcriptional regulator